MKEEQVKIMLEEMEKIGMVPDEYFSLYCIKNKLELPKKVNKNFIQNLLRFNGWLDSKFELTEKARLALGVGEEDFLVNTEKYRMMWPSIMLPTGQMARCSSKELQSKMKWFLNNYNYSWEVILKATEAYITHFAHQGYGYMRNSSYFIFKQMSPQLRTSTLADWCDKVSSPQEEKTFDINA